MIGLRVTDEEMAICKKYADEQVRSVASFARMLLLIGLSQYEAQNSAPPRAKRIRGSA